MHGAYEVGNQYRADFGPVARPSSNDFQLAAKVSRDPGVVPFLARWVFGDTIPPMRGHADWVSLPATAAAARAANSGLSARQLEVARLAKR